MLRRNGSFLLVLGAILAVSGPLYAADAAPSPATTSPATTATGTQTPAAAPAAPAAADASTAPTTPTEPYIPATWADLLRTGVRFGAIDLHDNNLLDEYAAVTDCEIYKFYFKDDFKWQEVRKKIRESAEMNSLHYHAHYYIRTGLFLDRYDFEKKIYNFTDESAIRNVNVFSLFADRGITVCNDKMTVKYIPKEFQAISEAPFTMLGIPLAPADAQSLLRLMNSDKNTSREVVIRFNMTVTYIARMHKEATDPGTSDKSVTYVQSDTTPPGTLRMDVHIDSVEFFEDPGMTKLIYSTKPQT